MIAHETGVANVIDPLGGSYYIEALTSKLEEGAYEYFRKIDALGGMVKAIEHGFPQREIADAAYRYQRAVELKERVVVGVNDFVLDNEKLDIPILKIDHSVEQEQHHRLEALRQHRDNTRVKVLLDEVTQACAGNANVMPAILDAARAYATLGEICGAMKKIFGDYQEPPIF